MAKFIKSVLHAGQTYHSPDGEVTPTPARLKHWHDSFAALKAAKYSVPIDWDHADTADKLQPIKLSEQKKRRSAKNTVGSLSEFKLAADGNSAELVLEVTDPNAEGRADRNEVYVSPVIMERWKDGHGTEYTDLITHVDFVNHPVDHSQGPFKKLPEVAAGSVALAIRMGLGKPLVRMGDNPFAKDDEDDEDEGDEEDEFGGDESTETEAEPENPDAPPAKATDKTKLAAVVAGFSQLGMVLPSDFDFANDSFLDVLLTSLNTLLMAQRNAEAEEAEKPDEEEPNMTVQDPGYAAMSLYANRQHQERLAERLEKLLESGRCTPDEHSKRKAIVATIKLALDGSGKNLTPSDIEKWLDSREPIPAGTFWSDEVKTKKMALNEAALPPHMRGESYGDEEVKQLANWALGGKPAAAK